MGEDDARHHQPVARERRDHLVQLTRPGEGAPQHEAVLARHNKDNDIRSGNFAALDAVAMTRTPVGVVGGQFIRVQQVQDDSGGPFGPNRFRANGAGLFYTTLVPFLGAALNVQYMKMIETRNALSGSFYQLRLSKQF